MSSISISTFQIPDWQHGGSTAKLRLYASKSFTDSLGVPHLAGTVGSRNGFYQEVNLTISGTTVTVPTFTTYSTTDARPGGETTSITGVLFDSKGAKREILFSGWRIPETPAAMTWATLETFNQANPRINKPENVLSDVETIALIQSIAGVSLSDASDVIKGRTKLSVAPVSASNPIAVGDNDPRIGTDALRATQSFGVGQPNAGVKWTAINPNATNETSAVDAIQHVAEHLSVYTDNSTLAPTFSNQTGRAVVFTGLVGQNDPVGSGTQAKTTFIPDQVFANYHAAGQRFARSNTVNAWGNGDAFISTDTLYSAAGVHGAGDEGTAFSTTRLGQWPPNQNYIVRPTITAVVTPATINTTTTQAITKTYEVQTVTVASTAGVAVGQWVIIDQGTVFAAQSRKEAVKVTAVGANSISGVFVQNHSSGATVTPATVLTLSDNYAFGQFRSLINRSATPHTTGTIASTSGVGIVGSGTNWSTSMVGGSALLPGYISFVADDYTDATRFTSIPLETWYPIASVADATHLNIAHFDAAGIKSYTGNAPADGDTYRIRPGALILAFDGNTSTTLGLTVVLETNTFTWTVGDIVESPPSPDGDVSGLLLRVGWYSPGASLRSGIVITNEGGQQFEAGISIGASNAYFLFNPTKYAYSIGVSVGSAETGIAINKPSVAGLHFSSLEAAAVNSVLWANGSVEIEVPNSGGDAGCLVMNNFASAPGGGRGVMKGIGYLDFALNGSPAWQIAGNLQLTDPSNNDTPLLVFKKGSTTAKFDFASIIGNSTVNAPSGANGATTSLALIPTGTSTTIGAGVGSIKTSNGNSADNVAWIPIIIGAVTYWIPAWATNTP